MCRARATTCCERSRHVEPGPRRRRRPAGRATWHSECCVAISMRCFSIKKPDVIAGLFVLLCAPSAAHASFLSPEAEDKLATIIALVVIFIVPVVLITVFWLVHILPEKIAHKRHHPQFEAIRTLCLLSLVFGGLLWPLAWLWAYSKTGALQARLWHGHSCGCVGQPVGARFGADDAARQARSARGEARPGRGPLKWKSSCSVFTRPSSG